MYTRSASETGKIDSLAVVEGKFKWMWGRDMPPEIECLGVYIGSQSGSTFGTIKIGGGMLSERAHEALAHFLDIVEEEAGSLILGDGELDTEPNTSRVESDTGLRPLGGG